MLAYRMVFCIKNRKFPNYKNELLWIFYLQNPFSFWILVSWFLLFVLLLFGSVIFPFFYSLIPTAFFFVIFAVYRTSPRHLRRRNPTGELPLWSKTPTTRVRWGKSGRSTNTAKHNCCQIACGTMHKSLETPARCNADFHFGWPKCRSATAPGTPGDKTPR